MTETLPYQQSLSNPKEIELLVNDLRDNVKKIQINSRNKCIKNFVPKTYQTESNLPLLVKGYNSNSRALLIDTVIREESHEET